MTTDLDNMTETELRKELDALRDRIRSGDATASEARRYQTMLMHLRQIQEAKKV